MYERKKPIQELSTPQASHRRWIRGCPQRWQKAVAQYLIFCLQLGHMGEAVCHARKHIHAANTSITSSASGTRAPRLIQRKALVSNRKP